REIWSDGVPLSRLWRVKRHLLRRRNVSSDSSRIEKKNHCPSQEGEEINFFPPQAIVEGLHCDEIRICRFNSRFKRDTPGSKSVNQHYYKGALPSPDNEDTNHEFLESAET